MRNTLNYLEALQSGEESGLRYFMSKYGDPLRFFAYKITKSKSLSEEIVSESFYKLWQRRGQAQSVENIKSFLYLITRNACYDQVGSAYQRRVSLEEEEDLNVVLEETDMLTKIIYIELLEQIMLELDKLPKKQAEIFRLSYIEGMGTDEICRVLDTTASNVYFAKSKVLSLLRQNLSKKDIGLYVGLITWLLPLD